MFETMVLLVLVCPGRVAWGKGSLSFTPWWLLVGEYALAKVMAARNGTLNAGAATQITRRTPANTDHEEAIAERTRRTPATPQDEEESIERTPFPESNGR